jgi:hypothetical protein
MRFLMIFHAVFFDVEIQRIFGKVKNHETPSTSNKNCSKKKIPSIHTTIIKKEFLLEKF